VSKRSKESFFDYVLFNPHVLTILLCMSYIMGFVVCFSLFSLGLLFNNLYLVIMFGVLSVFAARNIWKNRLMFKHFRRKVEKDEIIDLNVADVLNNTFGGKDEER